MKIAYIILAHKHPNQLVRLVNRLNNNEAIFVIHVDRKASYYIHKKVSDSLKYFKNVYFLERYKVFWGDFSQVLVTIKALSKLFEENVYFDYVKLISGQDYPLKSNDMINDFLAHHQGISFIENFPLPSSWWLKNGEPNGGLDRVDYLHFRIFNFRFRFPNHKNIPGGLKLLVVGSMSGL